MWCFVGEKVERAGQEGGAVGVGLGGSGWATQKPQWLGSGEACSDRSGGSDGRIFGLRQQRLVRCFHTTSIQIHSLSAFVRFLWLTVLFPSGRTSVSRTVPSLLAGLAVSRLSPRTDAVVRPSSTCCLMTCGSSWSAGWRSWSSATGSAAPPVRLLSDPKMYL